MAGVSFVRDGGKRCGRDQLIAIPLGVHELTSELLFEEPGSFIEGSGQARAHLEQRKFAR